MPRLTAVERERAVGMLQIGTKVAEVAQLFGCTKATVHRLRNRFNQTGQTSDRPRSGRRRVTTPREDRYLVNIHLRDRFKTATSSAANALDHPMSRQTVSRRLRAAGIRAYRPYRVPFLTNRHKRLRLQWARLRQRWRICDWRRVLYTDESRFCISRADGRLRVYRRRRERYAQNCLLPVQPFGLGSVMVWGGICGNRKTNLVIVEGNLTAQRYINQVLRPVVLPFLREDVNEGVLYQQDNARPHVARIVQDFFTDNQMDVLPWPARSPDLSPIEHLWEHLDRKIRERDPQPATRQQLIRYLQEEWDQIPAQVIRRLTDSSRRRVQACIAAAGGPTRY